MGRGSIEEGLKPSFQYRWGGEPCCSDDIITGARRREYFKFLPLQIHFSIFISNYTCLIWLLETSDTARRNSICAYQFPFWNGSPLKHTLWQESQGHPIKHAQVHKAVIYDPSCTPMHFVSRIETFYFNSFFFSPDVFRNRLTLK